MSLLDKEFKADRLNVHNLKLNGIDISNFQIETLGDGKYIDSLRGDIQVQITPSMLNANGEYVIEQIPGMGRFVRAEVSSTPRPIYYLAPNGSDSNLGTKVSPWRTLTNVPNGSIVVLLNGTYSNNISLDAYGNVMECFYPNGKSGLIIIGESKTGVIINRTNTALNDDTLVNALYSSVIMNMTVNTADRGTYFYNCSFLRGCVDIFLHNITFNVVGAYCYGSYCSGTILANSCTINGGWLQVDGSPYTVTNTPANIPAVGLNNNNVTINGIRALPTTDASNTTYKFTSPLIDFKSNTLTFNTDKRNFDTITLNIWLEQ